MSETRYDPEYRIDLGLLKSGEPHWLNGKSLEEAFSMYNRITKQSALKDTYDFYRYRSDYRNSKIVNFLSQTDAFYKYKNEQDPDYP